ncbi:Rdx family-domain-containing protein [Scheffersomyces amazonensis]|uniref:Rdx family-domain-containing protein n=1 Tax=Scheffersomyces amazonensis TaxID=1078765 RepID=UPI00315D5109
MNSYPKVVIRYCAKCKWQNRAIWYVTEILQTFGEVINEVSVQPIYDKPGVFEIILVEETSTTVLYKRKFKNAELAKKYATEGETGEQTEEYYYDGFPDSKLVKLLIKDALNGSVKVKLGNHIMKTDTTNILSSNRNVSEPEPEPKPEEVECQDCKLEQ